MSITINGTTGISGVDGSAGTPALQGSDPNTGIAFGSDVILGSTGGTERFRVDSSGRFGIGTQSPGTKLQVDGSWVSNYGTLNIAGPDNDLMGVGFRNTSTYLGGVFFRDGTAGDFLELNAQGSRAIRALTNGTERARIDSSGRLLVGTSTATSSFKFGGSGDTATLAQFDGASSSRNVGLALVNHHTSDTQPVLRLAKSRGTAASPTVVSSSDYTGSIQFMGYDGTRYIDTARIDSVVDTTPGTNDMPGRLVFSTTSDGGSVVTERMRIDRVGTSSFRNTAYIHPGTDNASSCGVASFRWTAVYAVNGSIQTSDERQKTEVAESALGTDFIKSLRPVSYKWIEGGKRHTGEFDEDNNWVYESVPGQRTHWGFIAQEVKQAVDDAGVDFGGWVLEDKDDPESTQSLRYDQFIAPLTKALQEALAKIETLETRLTALEGGINS